MRSRIFSLVMLLLTGAVIIAAQSKPASVRLEEGRRAELNLGLEPAIQIYESIIDKFPADKPNGAAALVRIVKLYDLLNKADKANDACRKYMSVYEKQPEVTGDVHNRCSSPIPLRSQTGIFIAGIEPATLVVLHGTVRSLTDANVTEGYASFSPDSRFLAFKRVVVSGSDQAALIVRSLDNKTELEIKGSCPRLLFSEQAFWLADGKFLLSLGHSGTNSCLTRSDAMTGKVLQSVSVASGVDPLTSALSPDGKTLYTFSGTSLLSAHITVSVAVDLSTGTVGSPFALPMETFPPTNAPVSNFGVSPNGKTIGLIRGATSRYSQLFRFETDGDDRHFRKVFAAGTAMKNVVWNRDSGRILFAVSEDGGNWKILHIDPDGNNLSFIGLEVIGLKYFELNRDNTQIVFDGLTYRVSAPGPYIPRPVPSESGQPPAPNPTTNGRGARGI